MYWVYCIVNHDLAAQLYCQLQSIHGKPLLNELRDDLFEKAVRYARIRADWQLANPDDRQQLDEPRRLAHTAFIDTCNILARAMREKGLNVTWREQLGEDRKTIGDFACYIHCFLGLEAR